MKKIYVLQGLVIVGVVLTLLVNYLATAGVLNGVTPPEISDKLLTKIHTRQLCICDLEHHLHVRDRIRDLSGITIPNGTIRN